MSGTSNLELRSALHRIESVLGDSFSVERSPGQSQIVQYYRRCGWAYRLLHSRRGFIHVGLSRGDAFRRRDLRASAELVREQIESIGADQVLRVLELAPGLGANSGYLARLYPGIEFQGLDLSFQALPAYARRRNYSQEQGDYHDLSRFADDRFDLIFIVEALCYSADKGRVLEQAFRKLRPGGRFVVIDGYATPDPDANRVARELDQRARLWTDRSMALPEMEAIAAFRQKIDESDLRLRREEDLSVRTLPTLRRFERKARIYFHWPLVARVLNRLLPVEVIQNAAAALLMRPLVERSAYIYCLHILEKPYERKSTQ